MTTPFSSDVLSFGDGMRLALSSLLELRMALVAADIEQYDDLEHDDYEFHEWRSIQDAWKRVRSSLAVTDNLSAAVHPREQRWLERLLDEIAQEYHLETGNPIVGPPTNELMRKITKAIRIFSPEAATVPGDVLDVVPRDEAAALRKNRGGGRPQKWVRLYGIICECDADKNTLSDEQIANKYNQAFGRSIKSGKLDRADAKTVKNTRFTYGKRPPR